MRLVQFGTPIAVYVGALITLMFCNEMAYGGKRLPGQKPSFSYKLLEVNFVQSDMSADSLTRADNRVESTGTGPGIKAWYGDQESLFWILEFKRVSFSESPAVALLSYRDIRIGLGDAVKKNGATAIYGSVNYRNVTVDYADAPQVSSSGYDIELGVRIQTGRLGEWLLAVAYEDVLDTDVIFKSELAYPITSNIDALVHYEHGDTVSAKKLGVRYNF